MILKQDSANCVAMMPCYQVSINWTIASRKFLKKPKFELQIKTSLRWHFRCFKVTIKQDKLIRSQNITVNLFSCFKTWNREFMRKVSAELVFFSYIIKFLQSFKRASRNLRTHPENERLKPHPYKTGASLLEAMLHERFLKMIFSATGF